MTTLESLATPAGCASGSLLHPRTCVLLLCQYYLSSGGLPEVLAVFGPSCSVGCRVVSSIVPQLPLTETWWDLPSWVAVPFQLPRFPKPFIFIPFFSPFHHSLSLRHIVSRVTYCPQYLLAHDWHRFWTKGILYLHFCLLYRWDTEPIMQNP